MKIVEFRLAMPLTIEEYKVCQLYFVAKASLEDAENNINSNCEKGDENNDSKKGIVILKNESYINEDGTCGQYTYKRINLINKLPKWLLNFIDPKYCIIDEKSWNAYPYLKTVYESSGFPKAKIQVESAHFNGYDTEENALNLSEEALSLRKVIYVDIVNDKISYKDYNESEDPSLFYSDKAKRGKLEKNWKENHSIIMTCYKVFTINIPYFGIFCSKLENWIISALRDNILKYHRKAFCWIDEWIDLTIDDIRNLERDVQKKLNKFWNDSQDENVTDDILDEENNNKNENVKDQYVIHHNNNEENNDTLSNDIIDSLTFKNNQKDDIQRNMSNGNNMMNNDKICNNNNNNIYYNGNIHNNECTNKQNLSQGNDQGRKEISKDLPNGTYITSSLNMDNDNLDFICTKYNEAYDDNDKENNKDMKKKNINININDMQGEKQIIQNENTLNNKMINVYGDNNINNINNIARNKSVITKSTSLLFPNDLTIKNNLNGNHNNVIDNIEKKKKKKKKKKKRKWNRKITFSLRKMKKTKNLVNIYTD
ncbi:hypothetical protein PFNF135_04959 [Plasmodium falciparum NF135/5.C10]|uniref:Phosphatidylinositol transfer protein N-terminal domain-containing protein n=1 Tax=Plasmodium falciparum NF135/5.C10 TaxID=1036726 RepID=W4IAD4_PLAFA|nr:hypothetical protein PFNF135_04959 [Plasmodium falciparum NF135/5.C10]